jgi:iron-sulfur cluster repair protein YtfE (RIC family)
VRTDDECHSYINHIVAQHRRLNAMLRQMRNAILESVQPDEKPSFTVIARILGQLREELEHHFAQEEAGGCLDEAVSRCPALSGEVKRIEAEHPEILAKLDNLMHQARSLSPTPQSQVALQQAFDQLHRQLQKHEAAENRLLAQGFGVQPNGGDANYTPLIHDM